MDLGLRDRLCVVTGASRGIGRNTAIALAQEGARVVLVGRHEETLADVAGACLGRATVLAVDITASDAPEQILRAAAGPVEVLVNNAGTSTVNRYDELTDEDWQGQWELNVMAPMRLMRALVPPMAERGWGRVVNVCSSSGKRPSGTNMAYSVTKAAELSLSRAFADLYVTKGVLVNAVAPGPVDSDLWLAPGGMADQLAEQRGASRQEALEAQAGRVPMGRFGAVHEISGVIVFLCSEAASYVAGAAWSVDGGTVAVII
jgi:3-oxoacyl-[acyl-carrier protein] reductase